MEKVIDDDNLLEEILVRLPPKSAVRFMSTSKRWYHLISPSAFSRRHCSLSPCRHTILLKYLSACGQYKIFSLVDDETIPLTNNPILLRQIFFSLMKENPELPTIDYQEMLRMDDIYFIKDGSNGLFLLGKGRPSIYYLVLNPFTFHFFKLPPMLGAGGDPSAHTVVLMRLLFEPSKSVQYKVISVIQLSGIGPCQIQIYSSENRIWKASQELTYRPEFSTLDKCLIFDGTLWWLPPLNSLQGETKNIHGFDLDTMDRTCLPMPPFKNLSTPCLYFGESRGNLYTVEARFEDNGYHHYTVWVIRKGFRSWKHKLEFRLRSLIKIVYIHNKTEQQLQIFLNMGSLVYCLNSTRPERLEYVGHPNFHKRENAPRWEIFTCIPTLLQLEGGKLLSRC